jgi:hypothetical protein
MADSNSIREHFNQLANVHDSLNSLFTIADDQFYDLVSACRPAMERYRQLLDGLDPLIDPDIH